MAHRPIPKHPKKTPTKLDPSWETGPPANFVAFSGGKDSTAMALMLHEMGEDFVLLHTPTGNELPPLQAHIDKVLEITGAKLVIPDCKDLYTWVKHYNALPNPRMRWCTRLIKIEPCIVHLLKHPGSTLLVGLRADEEEREGLYGPYATYRYPLREWGWGIEDVVEYCKSQSVHVPTRTDCAICPYQRLGEWYDLWKNWPEYWREGERWEAEIGKTFRMPRRDTWPTDLAGMRAWFEEGREPRSVIRAKQRGLFDMEEEDREGPEACRVCRL
jgi:3'-phosphoadenosine 5'-phosphosulfate sulfotransferase (PAPS reductase)/FAD synthetase